MSDIPAGTVTFLFTDIEGSTKRWEQYPEDMQRALARHDEILRHAIEAEDGYIFKTVGDAFYAAFHQIGDRWATAETLRQLAQVDAERGDYQLARSSCEEAIEILRQLGAISDLGVSLFRLGVIRYQSGDLWGARLDFRQALPLVSQHIGHENGIVNYLVWVASLACAEHRYEHAATLLGTIKRVLKEVSTETSEALLDSNDHLEFRHCTTNVQASLSMEKWHAVWEEGHAMSLDQALIYAREELEEHTTQETQ